MDGVCLLVTGDEEIGSPTSRALIEDEARGCAACFVLEGAGPGRTLKTGRKGTSWYRIEITGRAAHAGGEPEKGINAAVELAHLILHVAGMGVPGAGHDGDADRRRCRHHHEHRAGRGVPHCRCAGQDPAEQDRVHAAMLALTPTLPGAALTVLGGPNRPPMEVTSGAALFDRARASAARDGLGELVQTSVGGGSDGNFTAGIGVPTLDGLGAVGGGAHADDEHILLDELLPRTALLVGAGPGRAGRPDRRPRRGWAPASCRRRRAGHRRTCWRWRAAHGRRDRRPGRRRDPAVGDPGADDGACAVLRRSGASARRGLRRPAASAAGVRARRQLPGRRLPAGQHGVGRRQRRRSSPSRWARRCTRTSPVCCPVRPAAGSARR